jgi:hypothetical protein
MAKAQVANLIVKVENGVVEFSDYLKPLGEESSTYRWEGRLSTSPSAVKADLFTSCIETTTGAPVLRMAAAITFSDSWHIPTFIFGDAAAYFSS